MFESPRPSVRQSARHPAAIGPRAWPIAPRRAFTLLELTVVLVITGVLLALAVPRMLRVRDRQAVADATNDLVASFSLARQSALARRSLVAVVFDTAAGEVHIRSAEGRIRRSMLAASYGMRLGANRDSAVFDARGLGYGVSNLTATVRRGSFVDTVVVSRLGRVRW